MYDTYGRSDHKGDGTDARRTQPGSGIRDGGFADPDNPGLSLHRDVYANPQISGASGVVGFTGPVSIHSDTPAVDWAEISLYTNGEKRSVGNRGYGYESDVPRGVAVQKVFGSSTMGWMTGDYYFPAFTIVAAAFYSVRLTDAQHAQVAEGIAEL